MTEARRWEDVKAELDELYDKDAWARAAEEQYDLQLPTEAQPTFDREGARL